MITMAFWRRLSFCTWHGKRWDLYGRNFRVLDFRILFLLFPFSLDTFGILINVAWQHTRSFRLVAVAP
jgi:hypothetical protein